MNIANLYLLGVTLLSLDKGTNSNAYTKQAARQSKGIGCQILLLNIKFMPLTRSTIYFCDAQDWKVNIANLYLLGVTLLSLDKGTNSNAYTKQAARQSKGIGCQILLLNIKFMPLTRSTIYFCDGQGLLSGALKERPHRIGK